MTVVANPNLTKAAVYGTAWRYATFFSGKLMVLLSTIVLARLLTKDDFGVVGYAVTTISFLDAMSDLGISPAVIYFQNDQAVLNTAFWLGLAISIGLFSVTWFASPYIALYFRDPRASDIIRILAITYPISALGSIHEAVLRIRLSFGKASIADFIQAVTKGGVSIIFAMFGFGPLSLIIGQISGAAIASIAYWIISGWRPQFQFAPLKAKSLLQYGVNIVWVDLLGIFLLNIDYLLVGRYLGAVALGVYTLGFRIPDLLILQFSRIISTVIFPIYTKMRDIPNSLAKGFLFTCRYVSLVTVPIGFGLALVAEPFVHIAFTEKWSDAIPVIQTISIYAVVLSLSYNAGSAYKAQGRPQVLTILAIVRAIILVPSLYWAVNYPKSIVAVGLIQVLVAIIGSSINLLAAGRLLKIPFINILGALRPAAVAGIVLCIGTSAVLWATQNQSTWLQIILASTTGFLGYIAALWLFERNVINEIVSIMPKIFKKG
jgi:O-antigen/teichoic acid export membrane protein